MRLPRNAALPAGIRFSSAQIRSKRWRCWCICGSFLGGRLLQPAADHPSALRQPLAGEPVLPHREQLPVLCQPHQPAEDFNLAIRLRQQLRFAWAIARIDENLQDSNRPIRQALPKDESLVLGKAFYAIQHPLRPVIPLDQHDRRVDLLIAVDTQSQKITRAPAAKATGARGKG